MKELHEGFLKKSQGVAFRTGIGEGYVQDILKAKHTGIIGKEKKDEMVAKLIIEIPNALSAFGVREEIDDYTLNKIIQIIFKDYWYLSVPEIFNALLYWTDRHGQIPMYGGKLDIGVFIQILRFYINNCRAKVVDDVNNTKVIEIERKRREQQEKEYDLEKDVRERAVKVLRWQDAPDYLYRFLKKEGKLSYSFPELKKVLLKAREQAIQETIRDKKAARAMNVTDSQRIRIDERLRWLEGRMSSGARTKLIARKLVVYDFLVNFRKTI